MQFDIGDVVRIKPEFRNPGETDKAYIITEVNHATQHCYLTLADCDLPLSPQEPACLYMLEKVE